MEARIATNGEGGRDAAEALVRVLAANGSVPLGVQRGRLGREDLEDCLAQAVLELIAWARSVALADDRHAVNALEQKFPWRVADRRRRWGRRPESRRRSTTRSASQR